MYKSKAAANKPCNNELNTCCALKDEAVFAGVEGGDARRNPRSSSVKQKREAGPPVTKIQEAHVANAQPLLKEDRLIHDLPLCPTDAPGSPAPTMEVRYVVFRSCSHSC